MTRRLYRSTFRPARFLFVLSTGIVLGVVMARRVAATPGAHGLGPGGRLSETRTWLS